MALALSAALFMVGSHYSLQMLENFEEENGKGSREEDGYVGTDTAERYGVGAERA